MTVFAPSDELTELDPTKRVRYSRGMIVGDAELRQDQRYLTARDHRHQRALHGWGVVSGLQLTISGDQLEVSPGAAIDAVGRWICIDVTQCADWRAWLLEQPDPPEKQTKDGPDEDQSDEGGAGEVSVWVVLRHDECATDLVQAPSGPCRTLEDSVAPSRIQDSFRLELTLSPPADANAPAAGSEELRAVLEETLGALVADEATEESRRQVIEDFTAAHAGKLARPCREPAHPGCVTLGRINVPLDDDGPAPTSDDPAEWIDTSERQVLLSTWLLQEWLLRIPTPDRSHPVPFPLGDLTDVDAPTAREGHILIGTMRDGEEETGDGDDATIRWREAKPDLNLLRDVVIPDQFGRSEGDAGQVLTFNDGIWRPEPIPEPVTPDTPAPPREREPHVRSRATPYAIVAAGVAEIGFGRVLDPDDAVNVRARYGGLRIRGAGGRWPNVALMITFDGYAEAYSAYPELIGRMFVVKLTPESGGGQVSAQVVAMHEGGILVYVGIQEFPGEFQEILETLNSEPVLGGVALHVEISAFDDPRAESHPVEKIQELMEERR